MNVDMKLPPSYADTKDVAAHVTTGVDDRDDQETPPPAPMVRSRIFSKYTIIRSGSGYRASPVRSKSIGLTINGNETRSIGAIAAVMTPPAHEATVPTTPAAHHC